MLLLVEIAQLVVEEGLVFVSGVDTNLNVNKEGTYIVHYYAVDDRGERGHSVMIVMVGNAK